MSQKSYVWNHGNPVAYEDPSGYSAYAPDEYVSFGISSPHEVQPDDGEDNSDAVAFVPHAGQVASNQGASFLTMAAMAAILSLLSGGGNISMDKVAGETEGYLVSYGVSNFPLSVAGNTVSGHDSVGDSLKITQGSPGHFEISSNIGSTANANVRMWAVGSGSGQVVEAAFNVNGHYLSHEFSGNGMYIHAERLREALKAGLPDLTQAMYEQMMGLLRSGTPGAEH